MAIVGSRIEAGNDPDPRRRYTFIVRRKCTLRFYDRATDTGRALRLDQGDVVHLFGTVFMDDADRAVERGDLVRRYE